MPLFCNSNTVQAAPVSYNTQIRKDYSTHSHWTGYTTSTITPTATRTAVLTVTTRGLLNAQSLARSHLGDNIGRATRASLRTVNGQASPRGPHTHNHEYYSMHSHWTGYTAWATPGAVHHNTHHDESYTTHSHWWTYTTTA